MNTSLKKFFNDYGIGGILLLLVVAYVFYLLYKYFSKKGMSGAEYMGGNSNKAYSNSNGMSPQPSEPLGQNEVFSSVNNLNSNGPGIPSACNKPNIQNPADLLPKDSNSQWAQLNPSGKGELANINLLKAGYHIGIDTIGQTLRNANQQIRSEPPNPQINVGPWNLSTIEPDFMRPPLEIGSGGQ